VKSIRIVRIAVPLLAINLRHFVHSAPSPTHRDADSVPMHFLATNQSGDSGRRTRTAIALP
jgi:hypothetical protein